ncbi:MAG: single-stranded DNA-binding protein [Lachnospiraceae bacterium]|nr:single-stranded DNA-binding protein [Lachnospiraceae bacterium]
MMNKVMLIGRLGKDPEVKYLESGKCVARFPLATDESYIGPDGNKVQKAEWHRIITFDKLAENCRRYIGKGRLVYIEGKMQTRKWEDQQGVTRYLTEIIARTVTFLDRDNRQGGSPEYSDGYGQSEQGSGGAGHYGSNQGNNYGQQNVYGGGSQYGNDASKGPSPSEQTPESVLDDIPF